HLGRGVEGFADHEGQGGRRRQGCAKNQDDPAPRGTAAGTARPKGGDEVRGGDGHSSRTFCRRTIQMNNGAPSTGVMTATATSSGRATTRPTVSAATRRTAPARAVTGRSQ